MQVKLFSGIYSKTGYSTEDTCLKKRIRFLSLLLSTVLVLLLFTGCSQKSSDGQKPPSNSADQSNTPEPLTLPIVKQPITLTYFQEPGSAIRDTLKGYEDMTVFKETEKRTGIHIEFHSPASGQFADKLNLMLATGETDDMMWNVFTAVGGAAQQIENGTIIPLNDLIGKYAPNIKAILDKNPELKKQVTLDDGKIHMVPETRLDPVLRSSSGFMIRKDWLDKLQLKVPESIEEWYVVLKAFKEKDPNGNGKADEVPFLATKKLEFIDLATAWDITNSFYLDNGTIKYGPSEPKYKDFVTTMRKWYSEGLIDSEYLIIDNKNFDSKILNSIAGSYSGALAGGLGRYLNNMADKDPKFNLTGVPNPKSSDGKAYTTNSKLIMWASDGISLSKKNKNPVETIKWLDFLYSKEGNILFNWGIEGQSHVIKDGKRQFTDLILKNPDKLTVEQAAAKYAGGTICSLPLVNDVDVFTFLKLGLPQQKEASGAFLKGSVGRLIPPITFTARESGAYAPIMAEINTYQTEMLNKFIMGKEPLSSLDKFAETLKSMKIAEAIKFQQAAYDRYIAKK